MVNFMHMLVIFVVFISPSLADSDFFPCLWPIMYLWSNSTPIMSEVGLTISNWSIIPTWGCYHVLHFTHICGRLCNQPGNPPTKSAAPLDWIQNPT